jgi:hypothetical protein
MDFTIVEDEVEVHVTVIDPDAVVALSHGIRRDLGVMLDHIVLNLNNLQWIELRMDSKITHVSALRR